ncbi:single-stranded-DNA-specific exonuclease RecJ [Mycoplasmatota bacterium WC30]
MLESKYVWKIKSEGIIPNDQIFPKLLKNRNIDDYESFFAMGKESLIDPYLLNDMEKAKSRVLKAIDNHEKIMIFGDYDCDGISSISLLYRALKKLDADVYYDLPNRFLDGYGLNMRAVEKMHDLEIKLVITVDNGVTCNKEIDELNRLGIDSIITDHHEIGEFVPNAYAVIHTHLSENYPFKEIAGVMVAFKLAQALIGDEAEEFYDLAMIGTIADLMPLKNENQAIVNLGLKRLQNTKNLGLEKLIKFSNLEIINVTAISFKIAPKINSSGRLGKALDAVRLLVTDSPKEVNELILKIEKNHSSRKKLTEESFKQCEKLVNPDDNVIVIASDKLHEGVIGICAQKIVEKYQKSTLIITIDSEGIGKGSMRSFGNENILDMLHINQKYLLRYGGHSQAAGLQLKQENVDDLRSGLNSISLSGSVPILEVDMKIDLCSIEIETIQYIQDRSFFTASFLFNDLRVSRKQVLGGKHTKLILDCHGLKFDALHFNSLEYFHSLENGDRINIIAGLSVNNYRNNKKIQLMIRDIECKDLQVLDLRNAYDYPNDKKWIVGNYLEVNDMVIVNDELNDFITNNKDIKTIVLGPRKTKANFNKIVNKRELGKIYTMLKEIGEFKLEVLLRRIEYNQLILKYAIKIFIELELIVKNEDYYLVKENAIKNELQNSFTYNKLLEAKKMIDFIYFDYPSHIKTYFKDQMEV